MSLVLVSILIVVFLVWIFIHLAKSGGGEGHVIKRQVDEFKRGREFMKKVTGKK